MTMRNLDEMLRSILRKIKTVFRIEGASIALHDADQKKFYFIHTVEEKKQRLREDATDKVS